MIIDKKRAKQLVKAGYAVETLNGRVYCEDTGKTYQIVDRLDLYRVDHYLVGDGDLRRNWDNVICA